MEFTKRVCTFESHEKQKPINMKKTIALLMLSVTLLYGCSETIVTKEALPETTTEQTQMVVTNNDTASVLVYLTLGGVPVADTSMWVQSVDNIFGLSGSGLVGFFTLGPGDTLFYTPPAGKGIQGNFCFITQSSQCDGDVPGTTVVEFCLNNYGTIVNAQETCDISCVSGVTFLASVDFSGGAGVWTANHPGLDTIAHIENGMMGENTNKVGVYPYGCDDCVKVAAPPTCTITKHETPSTHNICQVQRNAFLSGGTVTFSFISPAYEICKEGEEKNK